MKVKGTTLSELIGRRGVLFAALLLGLGLLLIFFGSGESGVADTAVQTDEERLAELCSRMEGVGECYAYIFFEEGDGYRSEDVPSGIAVVCEGGDNARVRARLSEVISSLFGIGTNRIRIEKLVRDG